MKTVEFNTKLNIRDIDKAEVVSSHDAMCVNGFYIVGRSVTDAPVMFYSKCSGTDKLRYPEGIFMPTNGDCSFYDAAEVFRDIRLTVWSFFPTAMTLIGDPR